MNLRMCIFFCTFEGTDLATLAYLVATFAKCRPYYSCSLFLKTWLRLLDYHIHTHLRASSRER